VKRRVEGLRLVGCELRNVNMGPPGYQVTQGVHSRQCSAHVPGDRQIPLSPTAW
jgi:hypothetical protein